MPAVFDMLYHEYCRARLAEMRKQLLIQPERHEAPEANCDAIRPNFVADRDSCRSGDSQREADHLVPVEAWFATARSECMSVNRIRPFPDASSVDFPRITVDDAGLTGQIIRGASGIDAKDQRRR